MNDRAPTAPTAASAFKDESRRGGRLKRDLAKRIETHRRELWDWACRQAAEAPPPFYSSVDLRDSGHKIAPVDSNLYPAGFNNICPEDQRTAPAKLARELEGWALRKLGRPARRVLVIPETHTSNKFYLENLARLTALLRDGGLEIEIGWWGEAPTEPLVSESGTPLSVTSVELRDGRLRAGAFDPDLVLLNNDFSSGFPKLLEGAAQPILPSYRLGWHTRRKSTHFGHYNRLAGEAAGILGIDPWILQVDTEAVDDVNFNEGEGLDRAADAVERVLSRTREAYARHRIEGEPLVFVKANSGTYGMGIMVVRDAEEVRGMNRRTKNKMSVGKNKLPIASVAVQEGIPTATLIDRLPAEPVIYLAGGELLGGFIRTNTERGVEDNLNSAGMVFRKLCMSDLKTPPTSDEAVDDGEAPEPVLELVYGTVARISALAAGCELAEAGG